MKQLTIREANVPFKARVLAAVPGKSLNRRIYTKELLVQSAPFYDGRPFIMDHKIEDSDKVYGLFARPRYGIERGMDGREYEGLWLDAVGLMPQDLFERVEGTALVPPLIRGFSIGGEGEGEFQDGGILIKKFVPIEGSLTAFPGIPAAHVATINAIRESFKRSQTQEVKKTSIPVKETIVSLEEAEKQAANVKEGPIPDQDSGAGTRQQNDARPGLPSPGRGKLVTHQQPQATTSADTGVRLYGGTNPGAQAGMASTGSPGPSNEVGPAGTSPDARRTAAGAQEPLPRGSSPAGNKSATRQLSGIVTAPGQKSELSPVDIAVGAGATAEADNPMQDHPGQSCDDAHPGETHDDYMADDEEENESDTRKFTVHHSQLSDMTEDDEPTGMTKDKQPMAHPGEEEEAENPILKTANQNLAPGAHQQEIIGAQDTIPVQARAYSLPVDTGIYQAALRFDRLRNPDRTKEAQEYIAAWNEGKKPPELPLRKVRVKTGSTTESVLAPGTKTAIATIQPTVNPREDSVPTKSVTTTGPGSIPLQSQSRVSTITATAEEILDKVRKEPFGYYNLAGRTWRKMLPHLLEVDR